jgi:hypothetical protein
VASVKVAETGRTYESVSIEFKAQGELDVKAIKQELGLDVGFSADKYKSMKIEFSTDGASPEALARLRAGDYRGFIADMQHNSHVVVTGTEAHEYSADVGGEFTPAPTQTAGADVKVTVGDATDKVLYDNGYRLAAYSK